MPRQPRSQAAKPKSVRTQKQQQLDGFTVAADLPTLTTNQGGHRLWEREPALHLPEAPRA